jgi:pentatricopeptide repeat protein
MCAKLKKPAWEKALEIYDTLKWLQAQTNTKYLNTISYSALISACGNAGRWEEALQVFHDMQEAAREDPNCEPNAIAYSALISALEKGGQLDKALATFDQMRESGIEADMITYSVLIQACKKADEMDKAMEILDSLHKAGLNATPAIYKPLLAHLMSRRDRKGGAFCGSRQSSTASQGSQASGMMDSDYVDLDAVLQQLNAPRGSPVERLLLKQHERISQLEAAVMELQFGQANHETIKSVPSYLQHQQQAIDPVATAALLEQHAMERRFAEGGLALDRPNPQQIVGPFVSDSPFAEFSKILSNMQY